MTKQEALNKIEELKKYIEDLNNKVGFEDDDIFLLSVDEYEKYKDKIPQLNVWWWLRSPGLNSDYAAGVNIDGALNGYGSYVRNVYGAVRPALRHQSIMKDTYDIGSRRIIYDYPFIKIDRDLYIAETPITFDKFDNASNDYATSTIRKFLKDWKNNR